MKTNTLKIGLIWLIMFIVVPGAQAGIISFSDTVADFSSPAASSGFPIDYGVVRTFNFDVGEVLAATVSGTWGNAVVSSSSAAAQVFIDGLQVAECIYLASCWQATSPELWSYTFTAADLATGILDDGLAEMQVVQTSETYVRLGALQLAGRLDTTTVPEPATLLLMGLGLAGIGWRRKKAA